MMYMNKRVKELRCSLELNQKDFGERLGITKSAISNIETGRFNVTDTMLKLMCSEFNVREEWLKTGEGNMYNNPVENELIKQAATLLGRHDVGFEALVETYSKLSETNKEILLKTGIDFFECLSAKLGKRKEDNKNNASDNEIVD